MNFCYVVHATAGRVRRSALILFATLCVASTPATVAASPWKADFVRQAERQLSHTYQVNPYVALPGTTVLAPEPNQLRFQDLRGVECYAQPDRLEVCGAPDTLAFLLFTKSEEDLLDIRVNIKFDEGLESAGFAFTPELDGDAIGTENLDTVSVQNPESPTFLLNEIRQADGGVVIYVGIRAECGVDFSLAQPGITFTFNYTTTDGTPCELIVRPEDPYSSNVVVPRVEFAAGVNIPNALIRNTSNEFCQNVSFTQTTPGAAASSALFTVEEYGFERGVMFSSLRLGGQAIPAELIETDPATGFVNVPIIGSDNTAYFGPDGQLTAGEVVAAQVCYRTEGCIPNGNFGTAYGVVSACEGELCTGPPDRVEAMIDPAFNSGTNFRNTGVYRTVQEPSICGGPGGAPQDYIFEIDIATTRNNPVDDKIESVLASLRSCSPSPFGTPTVEVVQADGSGTALDGSLVNVLETGQTNSAGVPTANVAGTIIVNFRALRDDIGGGLADTDGDGFFDDIPGGTTVTLRFTFPVGCSGEDPSCIAADPGDEVCQFTQLRLDGRRRCNAAGVGRTINFNNAPEFITASSAAFDNETPFNYPSPNSRAEFIGYDFDVVGVDPNNIVSKTRNLEFTYNLDAGDFAACPDGDDGVTNLLLRFEGDSRIIQDFDFTNLTLNGAAVPPGDVSLDFEEPTLLFLSISGSGAAPGLDNTLTLDVTLDTNYCSPPTLVRVDAFIQTMCTDAACSCNSSRACEGTVFRVDPQDNDCTCLLDYFVDINRISTGFTDQTRTVRVDPDDVTGPDRRRFVTGDTMEIVYEWFPNRMGDLSTINSSDRQLNFDLRLSNGESSWSSVDQFPVLWDYMAARLQEAEVRRADGTVIALGDIYSGPNQNTNSGVRIGLGAVGSTESTSIETGEVFHPGLPNGGYQFGTGGASADEQDGHRLGISISNFNGREDAITPFFEALGGGFREADTFRMVWHVPVVDNPGLVEPPVANIPIYAAYFSEAYVGDPLNNVPTSTSAPGRCSPFFSLFEYVSPKVAASSVINYIDDCSAEIVHSFSLTGLPADWYQNEWKPIAGIERFEMDFPNPFYYNGGSGFEALGIPLTPYGVDSIPVADTAIFDAEFGYYPTRTLTGRLVFNDSEFENGVRPRSYDNLGLGQDDVTTVGGDFPLIAGGLNQEDALVFRIPVNRLCGSEPVAASSMSMTYQAAAPYLADLQGNPFFNNRARDNRALYWTNVPDPEAPFYFPYRRLDGEFRNPGRQAPTSTVYSQINSADEFAATANFANPTIPDLPNSTETNVYTITPPPGQALSGALLITVDNSVNLVSTTSDAGPVTATQISSSDSATAFSLVIPTLPTGQSLSLTLETDLLFCSDGQVCIDAFVPCGDENVDFSLRLAAQLDIECQNLRRCYRYTAGAGGLSTVFPESGSQPICTPRDLSIQFTNDGTSDIADFEPTLFIPEGIDPLPGTFTYTVSSGGSGSLSDPTATPTLDDVYGPAFQFADGAFTGALGADGLNPGEVFTITFRAETSCEITSGLPLAARVTGDLACGNMLNTRPVFGSGVNVDVPEDDGPAFTFNLPDNINLSCGEEGTEILLTAINTGKAGAATTQICLRLPPGVRAEPQEIRPVAPENFIVREEDIEVTPIGTMGGEQICFPGPDDLGLGEFFCLNIPVFVDDVPCGPVDIGVFLTRTTTVNCATTGEDCEIDVLTSDEPYLEVNIVAPLNLIVSDLETTCTDDPELFDVNYSATIGAVSEPFFGVAEIELVFDVDGNGQLDDYDQVVAGPVQQAFNATPGDSIDFSGTFADVNRAQLCPLLLVINTDGCTCAETVLPFPSVLPDFLNDLGDGLSLCPGSTATIPAACVNASYRLVPGSAGTVMEQANGDITVGLNPGFGVAAPVELLINTGFGNCTEEVRIPVRQFEDFTFPDQTVSVCNVGCQEVDLNIPASIQDDIQISVTPTDGVVDATSPEPQFCDVQASTDYTVTYMLNGECMATSTISVVVDVQPSVELVVEEGCSSGFSLSDNAVTTPAGLTGFFDADGDGAFTPGITFPGEVNYLPGPMDIERGTVRVTFVTNDPPGPCGPALIREVFDLKIVDCGTYPWRGTND